MYKKKIEYVLFGLLIFIVLFFSTYKLTESPSVWYDEGLYVQAAYNMSHGLGPTFQFAPEVFESIPTLTVGYPLIYSLALVTNIFDTNILVARSMMVGWILCLVALSFLLIRRTYDTKTALLASILIATFPPLYGNGKSVLGEVPGLVFLLLSLVSIGKALQSQSRSLVWFGLAGFFVGLCVVTKPIFLILLPIFVGVFLYKRYKKEIANSELFWIALSTTLPILVWLFIQILSVGSISFLVTYYVNPYGADSLVHIILKNLKGFISELGPLYLLCMMIIWTTAVLIRVFKKASISIEEQVAFAFSVLIITAYLRIVGWYRYLFPAQVLALVYLFPSLETCTSWLQHKYVRLKNFLKIMPIVVWVLLVGYGFYGLIYDSWVAEYYTSDKTAFWQTYFNELSPETSVFFYNIPEVALFRGNDNYYQYFTLLPAGGPFGEQFLPMISHQKVDLVIIRTDALHSSESWVLEKYVPKEERYKYTILEKKI